MLITYDFFHLEGSIIGKPKMPKNIIFAMTKKISEKNITNK